MKLFDRTLENSGKVKENTLSLGVQRFSKRFAREKFSGHSRESCSFSHRCFNIHHYTRRTFEHDNRTS